MGLIMENKKHKSYRIKFECRDKKIIQDIQDIVLEKHFGKIGVARDWTYMEGE